MSLPRTVRALFPFALILLLPACENSTGPSGAPGFTLVGQIDVGDRPYAITVAGDDWVVANRFTSLMRIDAATMSVADTLGPAGFFPTDLYYHIPSQTLVVTDDASGKVRWVSMPDLTMTGTATIPTSQDPFFSNPVGLDYDVDNGRLYALETRGGSIALIGTSPGTPDTVSYRPAATGSYSLETGLATAVDPILDRLFLTSRDESKLFAFSTASLTKLDSLTADDGILGINSLLADPVNGELIVSRQEAVLSGGRYIGKLEIYDASTLAYLRGVDIPDYPDDGGLCWVTEGTAMAVVTGTWLIEFSVPDYTRLHAMDLGHTGARVAYDPFRGYFLVTFEDEDVVRVYAREDAAGS